MYILGPKDRHSVFQPSHSSLTFFNKIEMLCIVLIHCTIQEAINKISICYILFQVLSELESQRESLLRTRQRLEDADEELSQARRILKKMYVNILTNKILLSVIILLELAILGGSIYHKFLQ